MTTPKTLLPAARWLLLLDVVLAVWAAVWIVMGLRVAAEVEGLKELSGTLRVSGEAITEVGTTVETLRDLPLIGDRIPEPAQRIQDAGQSAVSSGRSSRESIEALSTLLGVAVAVIPSLPVLGFYLPLRVSWLRERRALERAAAAAGDDPEFEAFLAGRALQTIPYRHLRRIARDPWREPSEGGRERLAAAELRRLGIEPASRAGAR